MLHKLPPKVMCLAGAVVGWVFIASGCASADGQGPPGGRSGLAGSVGTSDPEGTGGGPVASGGGTGGSKSPSGGSTASGGSAPKPAGNATCTQNSEGCSCTTSARPSSTSCELSNGLTDVCCSSASTWPASGTCECTIGMRCGPLLPGTAEPGCFCALSTTYTDYEPGYEDSAACVSPPGGKCCFDEEVGSIACWDGITCDPNEREVSSRLLIAPRCPSYKTKQGRCY